MKSARAKQAPTTEFVCSACFAPRGCDCNAPAVEKVAAEKERQRQKARRWRLGKKIKKNNRRVPVRDRDNVVSLNGEKIDVSELGAKAREKIAAAVGAEPEANIDTDLIDKLLEAQKNTSDVDVLRKQLKDRDDRIEYFLETVTSLRKQIAELEVFCSTEDTIPRFKKMAKILDQANTLDDAQALHAIRMAQQQLRNWNRTWAQLFGVEEVIPDNPGDRTLRQTKTAQSKPF
jgi:hypothetical protein